MRVGPYELVEKAFGLCSFVAYVGAEERWDGWMDGWSVGQQGRCRRRGVSLLGSSSDGCVGSAQSPQAFHLCASPSSLSRRESSLVGIVSSYERR